MRQLFEPGGVAGRRVRARPGACPRCLAHDEQVAVVSEFLRRVERTARQSAHPRARAEAGIGIATTGKYLPALRSSAPRIRTRGRREETHD